MRIAPDTMISRNEAVLFTNLGEEVILMDAEGGQYFNAKTVGASIWELLETPQSFQQVCAALEVIYDIDRETCAHETARFVIKLKDAGLVDAK